MALTREDLDAAGCGNPLCTIYHPVMVLAQTCHQAAGLNVVYSKRTGTLGITCRRCNGPLAEIAVARSELVQ
jgi:hypothetical protein